MSLASKLKSEWDDIKGLIKDKWEEFSDDDIEKMEGKKDNLVNSLVKKYKMKKEDAEKEVAKFWK